MASNCFPQFSDGNVEIHFTASEEDEKYVLHSWQLSLHSPWFKASLSERWKVDRPCDTADGKHRWIYELRFDKDSDEATLVQKASQDAMPHNDDSEMMICDPGFSCSVMKPMTSLLQDRIRVLKAHQDMFKAIYHVETFFRSCCVNHRKLALMKLAEVAQMYGCEDITKLPIENNVQKHKFQFELRCADDPVDMIGFALAVKSKWVFCEAATHLLGRSDRFFENVQDEMEDLEVAEWLVQHRTKFRDTLCRYELQLFRLEAEDGYYANAAVNFFRHWLTEQLKSGSGSELRQGYAGLYHTINEYAYSYKVTTHKEAVRKYMTSVYRETSGNIEAVIRNIEPDLKNVFSKAAAVLQPILLQKTRWQNTAKDKFRALTFMDLEFEELPLELEA